MIEKVVKIDRESNIAVQGRQPDHTVKKIKIMAHQRAHYLLA